MQKISRGVTKIYNNKFKNSNADFPDHLIARVNESAGCESTVTFDKKASKQTGFEILKQT